MSKLTLIAAFTVAVSLTSVSATAQSVEITTGDTVETEQGRRAKTDELFFDALKARKQEDNKHALIIFKQFVAVRPEVAAAHFEMSRIYAEDKQIELSLISIKKAMNLDPSNKWYKETYATILATNGKYAEAALAFAQLSDTDRKDDEYAISAAECYEKASMFADALRYTDTAIARNVDDEELLMRKIQLHLKLNSADKAAEVAKKLIADYPKNGRYYKLLGEIYDNNKMPEKATAVYQDAEKKLPNDASVQLGLAGHYLKTGDTTKYKDYVRKAITNNNISTESQLELLKSYIQSMPDDVTALKEALPLIANLAKQEPNDAMILEYYGEALEGSNYTDSAAIMYKKSLAIKPGNFSVWGRLMISYLDKQYADSLIKYSEKAMRLFPNQAVTHFYNGVGHMNKNNFSSAAKAIVRAIDLQPDNETERLAQMYSTLGDVYYSNKEFTQSDEAFEKALSLDPNDASVLNNYSYYLSERGIKLDAAEKMSKKSLELRPGEATFLDTYAWILYKKSNYKEAKVYILKAIEAANNINDGTLYEHLGDIQYKLNEKDKALENWKKAKEKGSDGKYLDKKISESKLYE